MARNCTVSASDFFLSSAWPRVAPASRAFTTPSVVTVGTTFRRCPCPAIPPHSPFRLAGDGHTLFLRAVLVSPTVFIVSVHICVQAYLNIV
jgi:hypothetical protein